MQRPRFRRLSTGWAQPGDSVAGMPRDALECNVFFSFFGYIIPTPLEAKGALDGIPSVWTNIITTIQNGCFKAKGVAYLVSLTLNSNDFDL